MDFAAEVIKNQNKDEMLRRALERIIGLYTDKSHFIYELLQNAEDAKATKIKFIQHEDMLEVIHDGNPFSLRNLQGLCDIGLSDKTEDLNQIGEFGVGFKSVFGICDTVKLYSHPVDTKSNEVRSFAVEIIDFTQPKNIEDVEIETGYTTKFIFPYHIGESFSGYKTIPELNSAICSRLQNLGITTLLFMKNLQAIDYIIDLPKVSMNGSYRLNKTTINGHCQLVSAEGESGTGKEEKLQYLVFSRELNEGLSNKTIDIAYSVVIDKNGEYSFRPARYPYISVYFPTETPSELNFIVQGPYRTTPNRSSVPTDEKENKYLANQTAELFQESLIELRDMGHLDYSLIGILPLDKEPFEKAPLFTCVYYALKNMLKAGAKIIPCKDGGYASLQNVKLARGDRFAEVFSDDLISLLINDGKTYHWIPTYITETAKAYKKIYEYFSSDLGIEVMRPENMRNYFNDNPRFLESVSDEWLVQMYEMYSSVPAAFSKERGKTNMLTAKFVKTNDGEFIAPFRKAGNDEGDSFYRGYENSSYLPNIFIPLKHNHGMENLVFVDEQIFEKAKHFFVDILGLQKPNEYEFFIQAFKRRIHEKKDTTKDQHITELKKLLRFRKIDDYREEVDNLIENYIEVRCKKEGKFIRVNPCKSRVYFSVTKDGLGIEQYFKNIREVPFVDMDFYEPEGITYEMMEELGVEEDISLYAEKTHGEYYTGNPGRQPEWNTYGEFRWKLTILDLDDVLEYISENPNESDSMAKSSVIFKYLMLNEEKLFGHVHIGGSTQNKYNEYAEIVKTLREDGPKYKRYGSKWNGKWLFTSQGELVSQGEITKGELHSYLYGEPNLESSVYDYLGFKKSESERLADIAKIFDNRFSDEERDQFFEMELQRRYGVSTEDMEESFGGNRINKKASDNNQKIEGNYDFPSSAVKDWGMLRQHAAEVFCFAMPVEYQQRVITVRPSRPDAEIAAYLGNMYKMTGSRQCACQMCHKPFPKLEKCQLKKRKDRNEEEKTRKEIVPFNLGMCPNCAKYFRTMQGETEIYLTFMERIQDLSEQDIMMSEPVRITMGNESIWFTQTHIAEIKELLILEREVIKSESISKQVERKNIVKEPQSIFKNENLSENDNRKSADGKVMLRKSDLNGLAGKTIYHIKQDAYAKVTKYENDRISVIFESGPRKGTTTVLSASACIKGNMLQLVYK